MISIIIPTYNRVDYLKQTLQSLANQEFDQSFFEVVVIDNGSTDTTSSVCNDFASSIQRLVYYYDPMPGLLTGRHKGAELSTGEILAFIDDDVQLNACWLKGVCSVFTKHADVQMVTGPCFPIYEAYPPEWTAQFWNSSPYGGHYCTWLSLIDLGENEIEIDPLFVFGLNFSIRKSTFYELGGFHPDNIPNHLQKYQGDGETGLSLKARALHYKALYTPSAMLHHIVPEERLSVNYFERRAFYQGVCDSFTKIRTEKGLYPPTEAVPKKKEKTLKTIARKLQSMLTVNLILSKKATQNSVIEEIKTRLAGKHNEGFRFHQLAFAEDKSVQDWTLKENYWNYKLPNYD